MNTLKIILYTDSEINYKTTKKTALTALEECENKAKNLGLYNIHFVKVKNALLLDDDGFIEDYIYNPLL